MPRRAPRRLLRTALAALTIALVAVPSAAASPVAAAYPPLPLPLDRQFLGNLSAPTVAPGGSTRLTFGLTDPASLGAALDRIVLTFQVYAFNGFPGNASAELPVANAPVLSNATSSGSLVTVSLASLASGASYNGSVGIATSGATPAGTFAIRTSLAFNASGTAYLLESRGWFSASVWDRATEGSNGTATLNLTELGVSGVLPETGVLVAASDWGWALGALLAAAFVLLAAGAWVYFRRGPGSTEGTG